MRHPHLHSCTRRMRENALACESWYTDCLHAYANGIPIDVFSSFDGPQLQVDFIKRRIIHAN